ncbi:putative DNA / RNA helicase domain protein [Burkholderia pseudomallei TSV44]|nr:putative DNA / RNA helicase domain protein [Burkholderia pseudomallei TSV44]
MIKRRLSSFLPTANIRSSVLLDQGRQICFSFEPNFWLGLVKRTFLSSLILGRLRILFGQESDLLV